MARCNENDSVERYRDHYMRLEELPGIDMSKVSQPHDLLTKIRDRCNDKGYEPLLARSFVIPGESSAQNASTPKHSIRVMQWNLLAQALSTGKDNFVRCPPEALEWDLRRIRILEEILRVQPDILCLQEVDHYGFLVAQLEKVGYNGYFFPKIDSPALYTENSNGPDGCAMFYRTSQLELTKQDPVVLQANGSLCNQVCIISTFKSKNMPTEFLVATTHLKAKEGWGELRFQQGSWLLQYLEKNYKHLPMIITGDFNGSHVEPVYSAFRDSSLGLASTYALASTDGKTEPPYTTFKIRGGAQSGEKVSCRTIDYMWITKAKWDMTKYLSIPTDEEIGPDRLPSFTYPSDHFSLAADYTLL